MSDVVQESSGSIHGPEAQIHITQMPCSSVFIVHKVFYSNRRKEAIIPDTVKIHWQQSKDITAIELVEAKILLAYSEKVYLIAIGMLRNTPRYSISGYLGSLIIWLWTCDILTPPKHLTSNQSFSSVKCLVSFLHHFSSRNESVTISFLYFLPSLHSQTLIINSLNQKL